MIEVNPDGTIECYQGNSGYVSIAPLDGEGNAYFLEEGDYVVFAVRAGAKTYIRRRLTSADQDENGLLMLFISHEETEAMPVYKYKFDCLFVSPAKEQYDTFILPSKFEIKSCSAKVGDE